MEGSEVVSLRPCLTRSCPHDVREGLVRAGKGVDGQPLADGSFCWRCRAKHGRDEKRNAKARAKRVSEEGAA